MGQKEWQIKTFIEYNKNIKKSIDWLEVVKDKSNQLEEQIRVQMKAFLYSNNILKTFWPEVRPEVAINKVKQIQYAGNSGAKGSFFWKQ